MDDGSRSVAQSMEMLQMEAINGVTTVIATPHYYAEDESIGSFLNRREKSAQKLFDAIRGIDDFPCIILGAEVCFFSGMSQNEDILSLCIAGTRLLLLEMPFKPWSSLDVAEVENLIISRRVQPVLAHINRYTKLQSKNDRIDELVHAGAQLQVNTEAFYGRKKDRHIMSMLKYGQIQYLGSDCHDTSHYPPDMEFPAKNILRDYGCGALSGLNFSTASSQFQYDK